METSKETEGSSNKALLVEKEALQEAADPQVDQAR